MKRDSLLGFIRLDRLERTIEVLVDRLDSRLSALDPNGNTLPPESGESILPPERNSAPVFLILDAATDAGVRSPDQAEAHPVLESDVISTGLIELPTAYSLLALSV